MSANLTRLRRRAAEFEQKKQLDRALEVYVQILDEGGKDLDDEDVPLFNRVGDMLMRKGSVTEALGYYERAVDVYAERGYLNNAIALCSKILRQSPGRAAVYYKLARISARKGFKSDARKNFLEYADRMQKLGMADEAFRALKEFASLYPDQDDVRLILAELLSKENRKGEALEQLQSLYEKLQAEGRGAEARATIDRMRAIDPHVTPHEGTQKATPIAPGDLVFLDLSDVDPPAAAPTAGERPQPRSARAPIASPVPALTGLAITFIPDEDDAEPAPRPEGFESTSIESEPVETRPVERSLTPEGSELVIMPVTSEHPAPTGTEAVIPLEEMLVESSHIDRIEHVIEELAPSDAAARAPSRTPPPLSGNEFADIELDDAPRESREHDHDLSLPGELPVTPEDVPATPLPSPPPPSFESEAALEDGRAAAEEAADLAADMVVLQAVHQPPAGEWLSPVSPVAPDDRSIPEEPLALNENVLPGSSSNDVAEIPDDFLAAPPTFGAPTETVEEHAFPPLAGLTDVEPAVSVTDEIPIGQSEPAETPPAPTPRATISIGSAESHLRCRLELDPENWELRRQLGEALLDAGDRDGGLYELELAMAGLELRGWTDRAQEVIDVILKVAPSSISHHQKRVEYAVRSRDRGRLTYSYLELADALFRTGAGEKAVAVYGRVLELDRGNERAEFALATLAPDELARLRRVAGRPDRWTDELVTIGSGKAEKTTSAPPPLPDERQNGAAGEAQLPSPRGAGGSGRVRFPTLELPVPDWGEGVPVRRPDPGPARFAQKTPEPAPGVPAFGAFEQAPDEAPPGTPDELIAADVEVQLTGNADVAIAQGGPMSGADARVPTPRAATPLSVPTPRAVTPISVPHESTSLSIATRTATPYSNSAPEAEAAGETGITSDSDFVDLGEWLRNTEPTRSTRMQVEDPKPTGDEQADFEEMLRRFKRGVAENVEAEDYEAHYDLGVAYKEMGLIDEAIAQFQKSLRDPLQRVRSYEALGQCFVEKQQYPIAAALLQRATEVPGSDDQQLVGVLYLLGFATEHLGRPADALPYYLRVFAVDIEFRDVAERVAALGKLTT